MIKNGEIQLIVNTPDDRETKSDAVKIRSGATANRIPIMTTLSGTRASIAAIRSLQSNELTVVPLVISYPKKLDRAVVDSLVATASLPRRLSELMGARPPTSNRNDNILAPQLPLTDEEAAAIGAKQVGGSAEGIHG